MKTYTAEFILALVTGMSFIATPSHALRLSKGDGWELNSSGALTERYDDNITYQDNDKLSDWITEPAVSAQFRGEGKLQSYKLEGALKYPYYRQHEELSHLKTTLAAEWAKELSKHDRILFADRFDMSEEPKDFRDAFGRVVERAKYARNRAEFEYIKELSRQVRAHLALFSEWNDFSAEPLRDSGWHGGELDLARGLAGDLEIYAGGGWDVRHFVDSEEAYRTSAFAGVRKELSHRLRLHLRGGADLIQDYRGELSTGPLLSASLEKDWDERSRSTLNFTSRHQTNAFVEDIFDAWEIRGNLSREISPKLRVLAEVFYGEGDYVVSGRQDDLGGVLLGLAYEVKKDMVLEALASRTDLSSSDAEGGYTKNTISAGLKVNI